MKNTINTQQKNNNALNELIIENKGISKRYMAIKNRCIYKKIIDDVGLIEIKIPLYHIYYCDKYNKSPFRLLDLIKFKEVLKWKKIL